MSDEGRLVADRYRIVGRIGTGAMGAVWQAHDEVLGRTVAIKQLLLQPHLDEHDAEDARQRTMREGRIAARLHHPNAISVFDVVTDDSGQPCLIMEYLNSTSLAAVLQERRTLPPTEVARIGAQVAAALREAHAVGIVHRDIKPGNILLGANGVVKITDFGISRAKDDVTVTKTGMIAGTPAYLAPEVAIGGEPGPESDVFSLGSTLYAACEGQPPFGLSENTLSLLHAVAAGQINPPRQSGPLASVLAVLLHPEVEHRPTAEECEELLAAVARGETPLGGPADETMMAPSAGVLGAAAVADPNATQMFDDISAGHSGTLLGGGAPTQAVPYYDEDDYPEATGYPEDDYDGYGRYEDDHAAGGVPPGLAATRAVPVPPHERGGYEDDYDDYDDEPAPPPPARSRPQMSPVDEDDGKPGAWKRPAIIGGIVVVGLVALVVWLLSPNNPEAPAAPVSSSKPSPVATSDTPTPTTEDEVSTADVPPPVTETSSTSKRATTSRNTEPASTTPRSTAPKTTTPTSEPPASSSSEEPPTSSSVATNP
ncbi:serine/threonine-protein kinase [Amycolatopsis rifamycinica]|uniref:non-specific serine/threonine protein kinase n=1 Tax=Amycolatopsis rifamycinica TaxID=287986 RepID=A0A066TTR8_9PSEU|nr:serine/threonine-protein kinase [Amycolatopsis rifamycinica]KDN18230.1 serine/threonine protein kinase [Amycolatopsis rifamycinica]